MIDRTQIHPCLHPRTLLVALGISCGLFSVLLLAWFIAVLAGSIAFAACWLVILLAGLVVYGVVIVIAAAIAGGGISAASKDEKAGCAAIVCLGIGIFVLVKGFPMANEIMNGFSAPVIDAAQSGWGFCFGFAVMFMNIFTQYKVYLYSWFVIIATLLVAASVLLFLGILRCETWFKAAFLKIRYSCPKCHSLALPLYCCSNPACSFAHDDLKPTIYGIWNARCGKCGTLLPTSDLAGRLALKSICREKGCDPDFSLLGTHSEYHLAVVGASNSGKTNLMITALRQLIESFAPSHGITVRFANAAEEIEFQRKIRDLDAGQAMGATVRVETPTAFNLVLEPKQGPSSTLYMYDAAGEDFQIGDRMLTGQRFHRYTDAILLVVDPSAEEDLQRQYPDVDWKSMNPARENISVIEGRMIPFWERALGVGSDRPFAVPMAVIVTKMDGLKAHFTCGSDELNGTYADMEKVAEAACRDSARVRQFLIDGGLGSVVQNLESRFPRSAFFAISALGRSSQSGSRMAFESIGVLAPLCWACYMSGALTDSSTVTHSVRHATSYSVRMLRGKEGAGAALAMWSVLATASGSLALLIWHVAGTWGLVSSLVAVAIALPVLYVREVLTINDRQRFRQEFEGATYRLRERLAGQYGKRLQFIAWSSCIFMMLMCFVGIWYIWWPLVFVALVAVATGAIIFRKAR